jgi:hypothetical protein
MDGQLDSGPPLASRRLERPPRQGDRHPGDSLDAVELTERIELIEFLWRGPRGVQPVLLTVRHLLE